MNVVIQSVLSLRLRRATGFVGDSGDGCVAQGSHRRGYTLPRSILRYFSFTEYQMKILSERGYSFVTTAEREVVRDVNEKLCYIALDFDNELMSSGDSCEKEKTLECPDGIVIYVGAERVFAQKSCSSKSFTGKKASSFHDTSFRSILKFDVGIRNFCGNVVMSGGTTMVQKDGVHVAPGVDCDGTVYDDQGDGPIL